MPTPNTSSDKARFVSIKVGMNGISHSQEMRKISNGSNRRG